MKYYIIAGEASGDLHGGNLMKSLTTVDKNAEFRFWGGDNMSQYGGEPVKHIRELAFMGFIKVLMNIRTIAKNINFCKSDVEKYNPDVLILIDYAGFNLKIAEFAKSKGIRVHYYISPKIWAWKTNRVHKIKKFVDKMFTILPFETEFYKKYDFDVNYVGNPINDEIHSQKDDVKSFEQFTSENKLDSKPIVALLPGSRKQEIKLMLPVMIEVSHFFPNHQFICGGAPAIDDEYYKEFIGEHNIPVLYDQTYQLLKQSKAALVTSGTATLETALLNLPQIVCYHTNIGNFLYKIGRSILKVKWLSLVNLILEFEAVKELTQSTFKKEYLVKELKMLLENSTYRNKMLTNYAELQNIMGSPGASDKAAKGIFEDITN
ncbi:MAG: lipid-A-disaccharide synthase [Salinivirgaceae bacterium]|nr:lipid-A-disaccharide synthase [Salinivirgaceae bacterium]